MPLKKKNFKVISSIFNNLLFNNLLFLIFNNLLFDNLLFLIFDNLLFNNLVSPIHLVDIVGEYADLCVNDFGF